MASRKVLGRTTLAIALVGAGILSAPPVRAHHSMVVQFSVNKPITLRGTISKVVWVNPHGHIYLDVKGPDGQVETWTIETGATSRMIRRGLKRSDLAYGLEVIVGGYASRDGKRTAAGMIVTFPDREANPDLEASFSLGR